MSKDDAERSEKRQIVNAVPTGPLTIEQETETIRVALALLDVVSFEQKDVRRDDER